MVIAEVYIYPSKKLSSDELSVFNMFIKVRIVNDDTYHFIQYLFFMVCLVLIKKLEVLFHILGIYDTATIRIHVIYTHIW